MTKLMVSRSRSRKNEEVLKASLRSVVMWKYIFIFFVFVIVLSFVTYDFDSRTFVLTSLKSELLTAIVTSLIVALIYDLFTKNQERVMADIERAAMIDDLSRDVFLARGVNTLSDEDIYDITNALVKDDRFLVSLARVTAVDDEFVDNVLHAHLRPLWRGPVLRYYEWDNKLVPKEGPDDPVMYTWKSHQRFVMLSNFSVFRVAITDNAYLGAKLINSTVFFNNLIVIGKYVKSEVDGDLQKNLFLGVEKRLDGRRVLHPLHARIVHPRDVFKEVDELQHFTQNSELVTFVEYILPEHNVDNIYEFDFAIQISYFEPFFYVEVENIAFVGSITIEYHEIYHRLEKLWVTSFIGNTGSEIEHDEHEKLVTCHIDGIVMAGHAVLLTWLPKPIA